MMSASKRALRGRGRGRARHVTAAACSHWVWGVQVLNDSAMTRTNVRTDGLTHSLFSSTEQTNHPYPSIDVGVAPTAQQTDTRPKGPSVVVQVGTISNNHDCSVLGWVLLAGIAKTKHTHIHVDLMWIQDIYILHGYHAHGCKVLLQRPLCIFIALVCLCVEHHTALLFSSSKQQVLISTSRIMV